ncbi:hypothetical protein [Bacillus wiedmannii]|uniref:hypothetical protein n=1 Tax=Bacillus wiedmannii TaxID=1890302 RepID=UPI0021D16C16|nr:hypothetical protein [Bacillus wiedmannii]MCU5096110.1 hypothetical protein [Bacillus wiedmannii]
MHQNVNQEIQHEKEVKEKVEIYCAPHRNCCHRNSTCDGQYKYFSNTGNSVYDGICC